MYIAYSALNQITNSLNTNHPAGDNEIAIRYQAYQKACEKYSNEIEAIQKYLPNWIPSPPTP